MVMCMYERLGKYKIKDALNYRNCMMAHEDMIIELTCGSPKLCRYCNELSAFSSHFLAQNAAGFTVILILIAS